MDLRFCRRSLFSENDIPSNPVPDSCDQSSGSTIILDVDRQNLERMFYENLNFIANLYMIAQCEIILV